MDTSAAVQRLPVGVREAFAAAEPLRAGCRETSAVAQRLRAGDREASAGVQRLLAASWTRFDGGQRFPVDAPESFHARGRLLAADAETLAVGQQLPGRLRHGRAIVRVENMSRSAKKALRFVVVLKLPENKTPQYILLARGIVERMTGNSCFATPLPSLAVVQAAVEDLSEAQTATTTGAKATYPVRDDKRRDLHALLQQLAAYVQAVAYAHPENAVSIVESAGMYLKRLRGPGRRVFGAKPGRVSTEVDVLAPSAGRGAGYEFQYSLDGGVTWLPFPQPFTTKASATLPGQKPGSTVHFHYRYTLKGVTHDWSDPVAIIVD